MEKVKLPLFGFVFQRNIYKNAFKSKTFETYGAIITAVPGLDPPCCPVPLGGNICGKLQDGEHISAALPQAGF